MTRQATPGPRPALVGRRAWPAGLAATAGATAVARRVGALSRPRRFFDSRQRGYVRCLVTPERWQTDLRVVDDARDPRSDARTLQSFAVESGRPGALRA